MFAHAHSPEILSAHQLDAYLEQGWFRMGQTIFTTNFLHVGPVIYSTIWLRIDLNQYAPGSTQTKIFKRNAGFTITIQPALVTSEKEMLYAVYKQTVPFPGSDSLQQLLFGKENTSASIYNTLEITLHDGDKLIACGFFDLGAISAEGIVSFFDPAYKKYSLGKYLIYLKIQYCKKLGLRYFYPGYFVPGNPHFDYKLTIGREVLQFFQVSSQTWLPIDSFSLDSIPYSVMHAKLLRVQRLLTLSDKIGRVLKYDFFDACLFPELKDAELLDFPVFLTCTPEEEGLHTLLVFDVRDNQYHLITCIPVWKPNELNPDPDFYSAYFLKPIHEVYACEDEAEIVKHF